MNNTIDAFFALVRAGLWEQDVRLSEFGSVDFREIHRLAREQAVSGLVTAGLDHVVDYKIEKSDSIPFLQDIVMIESRNVAMNDFVGNLFRQLNDGGIKTVLVKGQGIAQCYERPLWRMSGDVDLFFDEENYEKAKEFLAPLASSVEQEEKLNKHLAMNMDSWLVELHGLMPTDVSYRVNSCVSVAQRDIFENDGVRIWNNGGADIPLPSPDNDVIIIFTHFIQHFFVGGIGLRQICDWCRLLWSYKDVFDLGLLKRRLKDMGLMSEWNAFAAFAVEWLGMSVDAMPFIDDSVMAKRRIRRIRSQILDTGNFGHNKENFRHDRRGLNGIIITFFHRFAEFVRLTFIFPVDGPFFFLNYVARRTKSMLR